MATRWVGNPQPDQFVRVSSELLLAIARTPTNDREHRLLMAIVAATYGRFSDHVRITRVQLGQLTRLTAPQVLKGLAELQARGIIAMGTPERGKPVRIQLVKAYTKWQDGPPVDLAVEDAWRGIPRGQREPGAQPDDEPEQVSLWQVEVATGKLQVAHGKVNDAQIDASTRDPQPRKKREVETRRGRRKPPTADATQAATERTERAHRLELYPASFVPDDTTPPWLRLAWLERAQDQERDEQRRAELAGDTDQARAALAAWIEQHGAGDGFAAPTHPAEAGRGGSGPTPPGGLPRTTPTATLAASREAVDPARGLVGPSAPHTNVPPTNAAPPGQPTGARTHA